MSINWILLIIGGLFETGFAISLGKAQQATGKHVVRGNHGQALVA